MIIGITASSINKFDVDYQAILNYATTNTITKPSPSQRIIQNQLVIDLKSNGIWDKCNVLYIPANDGSADFGKINWIDPNAGYNLTASGTTTWTSNVGFKGDGTTGYFNTQWNATDDHNSLFTQNDSSSSVYIVALHTGGATGVMFGGRTALGNVQFLVWDNLTNIAGRFNTTNSLDFSSTFRSDMLGLNSWNRHSSANVDYRVRGVSKVDANSTSVAIDDSVDYFINARSNDGTAGSFSNHEWGYFDIGSSMDTVDADKHTLIDAYMTDIVA